MRPGGFKVFSFFLSLFLLNSLFLIGSPLPERPYKYGFFLQFEGAYEVFPEGDFDGTEDIIHSQETILIPALNNSPGFSFFVGYREEWYSLSLGVHYSDLDLSFEGKDLSGSLYALELDMNVYPFSSSRLQPYLRGGLIIPLLKVNEGASSHLEILPEIKESALFAGLGFSIGAGLEYSLSRRLALQAGVKTKFVYFANVKGIRDDSYTLDSSLSAINMQYHASLILRF